VTYEKEQQYIPGFSHLRVIIYVAKVMKQKKRKHADTLHLFKQQQSCNSRVSLNSFVQNSPDETALSITFHERPFGIWLMKRQVFRIDNPKLIEFGLQKGFSITQLDIADSVGPQDVTDTVDDVLQQTLAEAPLPLQVKFESLLNPEELSRQKVKELIDDARVVMGIQKHGIIHESKTIEDCMALLNKTLIEYATFFLAEEKSAGRLQMEAEIPYLALENLKRELSPEYIAEFEERKRKSFLETSLKQQLIRECKSLALERMGEFIHSSDSENEAINKMRYAIDEHCDQFIENNELFDKIPWATVEKVKDELEPFYVKEWLELERLNEVMSWKVKLMLTNPTYISVPMLYGGKMEQLRQYMMDMYGFDEEDQLVVKVDFEKTKKVAFSVKKEIPSRTPRNGPATPKKSKADFFKRHSSRNGKLRVKWDDVVADLELEPERDELLLWIPKEKGRQKMFKRLSMKQQAIRKQDFSKTLKDIGLDLEKKAIQRVWRLLDCNETGMITYKQFQLIVSPEAHINEFREMIENLSETLDDEFEIFLESDTKTKVDYIRSKSKIVTDAARLDRMHAAKEIYTLFSAFDVYMHGRLTLPQFRQSLEIAGLLLNDVHINILFHRMTGNLTRKVLTVEDFFALHGSVECSLEDFLYSVNAVFGDMDQAEYKSMKKRIFRNVTDGAKTLK